LVNRLTRSTEETWSICFRKNSATRYITSSLLVSLRAVVLIGIRAVVIVGLRAVVTIGLRAVVCGRRPLCRSFCRFLKPPRAGEVLPKFLTYSFMFILLQRRARGR
jgi:hypothetical protein